MVARSVDESEFRVNSHPQLRGAAFATAAMLFFSTPPVITRALSVAIPPVSLAYARWVIGALVLLPFVWRELPKEWPKLRAEFGSLTVLALCMVAGSTLSVIAVYYTTATNAVLVNASQPAITAVAAYFIARERLMPMQTIGVVIAFFGIVVMISRANLGALASLDIAAGDLIMLCAVLGWSLYAVFFRRREYTPSAMLLLFFIAVVGIVVVTPFYLVEVSVVGGFEPRPLYIVAIFYMTVFPTLFATYCWNRAIHSLGPNRAAIFINLIPIFGAALAMFFLGEQLFAYHIAGAILVFVGIALAVRQR